jgi:hypothetical protein
MLFFYAINSNFFLLLLLILNFFYFLDNKAISGLNLCFLFFLLGFSNNLLLLVLNLL